MDSHVNHVISDVSDIISYNANTAEPKSGISGVSRYPPDETNFVLFDFQDPELSGYDTDYYDNREGYISDRDSIDLNIPEANNTDQKQSGNSNNNNNNKNSNSNTNTDSDEKENEEYDDPRQYVFPEPISDNNCAYSLTHIPIGFGKQYISGASAYPPEISFKKVTCINAIKEKDIESASNLEYIENGLDFDDISWTMGDSQVTAIKDRLHIIAASEISLLQRKTDDNIYSINFLNESKEDSEEIMHNLVKWWIRVPLRTTNGDIEYIEMLADTGANSGCIDTAYALKNFSDYIVKNNKNATLNTVGGRVHPKFCVYFTFPTKSGILLLAKLYLVDNLPVPMIADLNMLYRFGYRFKQKSIPPAFKVHNEEHDSNLHIQDTDDQNEIHVEIQRDTLSYTFDEYRDNKLNQLSYIDNKITNVNDNLCICEQIDTVIDKEGTKDVAFHYSRQDRLSDALDGTPIDTLDTNHILNTIKEEVFLSKKNETVTVNNILSDPSILGIIKDKQYVADIGKSILNDIDGSLTSVAGDLTKQDVVNQVNTCNVEKDIQIKQFEKEQYTQVNTYDNYSGNFMHVSKWKRNLYGRNTARNQNRIFHIITPNKVHNVNFVLMRQSFLATDAEEKAAQKMNYNKILERRNFDYLKTYPEIYGPRFDGLHEATVKLCYEEFPTIWAKKTFDRRTMNVKPVHLGILPQFRHKTCYVPQYPLSIEKRKWYINYTIENQRNGFWKWVSQSMHCLPVTMVAKRNAQGLVTRYRPAMDCRKVNEFCELIPAHMPTIKDFDDLYSIKGLFTLLDLKNMFDCIPLAKRDQPWAVAMTPLGLFQMQHLTYGYKNAAALAQNIMNGVAMLVANTLIYIDDILMKHNWNWGTKEHIAHLRSMFQVIKDKNMLLNPTKFHPFVSECISFGYKRTLEGSMISDSYKKRILTFAKPINTATMSTFTGIVGYVARYVYKGSMILYWLNVLKDLQKPNKRIIFTPEANTAYEQIKYLVEHAPLLYNPTPNGMFCIKVDACNYGCGGVLYQLQRQENGEDKWVIIDMHSEATPSALKKAHSMVHEARAITVMVQHWQFHLLKRKFIIATDNEPISRLFCCKYRNLNEITQQQLLRLRIAIAPFTYEIRHVAGINNELADGLSRFNCKLVPKDELGENLAKFTKDLIASDPSTYASTAAPLKANDFKQKELTSEDWFYLKNKTKDTRNLQLSKLHSVNILHSMLPDLNPRKRLDWINKFQTRQYNNTMALYLQGAKNKEKEKLLYLIESANNANVLMSDEHAYNTVPTLAMIDGFADLAKITDKFSDKFCNELINITKQAQYEANYNDALVLTRSQTRNKRIAQANREKELAKKKEVVSSENSTDTDFSDSDSIDISTDEAEIYYPSDLDITDTQPPISQSNIKNKPTTTQPNNNNENVNENARVQTRSQTKMKKDKQIKRFDYLAPAYNDIEQRLKIRSQFMTDLFGYRGDFDIFNIKVFTQYQKSDNILNMVRYLIHATNGDPANPKQINKDMQRLRETDLYLYHKLQKHELRITHEGTLQVLAKIKLQKERIWLYVVPVVLRGKMMDYAHHNLQMQHFGPRQTLDNLQSTYFWGTMRNDINIFCKRCLLCNFCKGSKTHRAPMQIRERQYLPRHHIMFDFIGSIFGKYYILAIIDYVTGWTMLIPTVGTDIQIVVFCLLQHWCPLFGMFRYLDCDYGSSFNSKVFNAFMKASGVSIEYAEPENHRSIGRIERLIGLVQSLLQRFNVQLGDTLVDPLKHERSWLTIKTLLPHIQASINQRRPRFTTFSPNMLMFGSQVYDLSNVDTIRKRMESIFQSQDKKLTKSQHTDYAYLQHLLDKLSTIHKQYQDDWIKYTRLSKKEYDNRYNIDKNKIKRNRNIYIQGKKVLYFIGDRRTVNMKWKRKWTGPWMIQMVLNDSTVIIVDEETGNQKRVSIDRLKIFNTNEDIPYSQLMDNNQHYDRWHKRLRKRIYGHHARVHKQGYNLDFRGRKNRKVSNFSTNNNTQHFKTKLNRLRRKKQHSKK